MERATHQVEEIPGVSFCSRTGGRSREVNQRMPHLCKGISVWRGLPKEPTNAPSKLWASAMKRAGSCTTAQQSGACGEWGVFAQFTLMLRRAEAMPGLGLREKGYTFKLSASLIYF